MIVHMLLEGQHEEPLAKKLICHCGHEPGYLFGKKGCDYIREKASKFIYRASPENAVLVLTDFMDSGCSCPPEAYRRYITEQCTSPPSTFLCRFIVNELESWLMADRKGIATFLGIPESRVPDHPETVKNPKQTLVNLARASRKSALRAALVPPAQRHGGVVGSGYTPAITEFIDTQWSPGRAAKNAPSLARCIKRLKELPR